MKNTSTLPMQKQQTTHLLFLDLLFFCQTDFFRYLIIISIVRQALFLLLFIESVFSVFLLSFLHAVLKGPFCAFPFTVMTITMGHYVPYRLKQADTIHTQTHTHTSKGLHAHLEAEAIRLTVSSLTWLFGLAFF